MSTSDARKPGRGRIYNSIVDTIGDTPIIRLDKLAKDQGVEANLLAKLEFFNPIASVKDRIGVALIESLEAQGKATPGKTTFVEPTSGNTGIALAFADISACRQIDARNGGISAVFPPATRLTDAVLVFQIIHT